MLDNIAKMAGSFDDAAFVFVENDSRDDTRAILDEWCGQHQDARVISLDGLAKLYPPRTRRLAEVRNTFFDLVRSEYSQFDYAVLLDCDDINALQLGMEEFRAGVDFLASQEKCAGVFANSRGVYYDLWALRHETICPTDVWEDIADFTLLNDATDEVAYAHAIQPRVFSIAEDVAPIPVESAFGGTAIYKIASVLNNRKRYSGWKRKRIPLRRAGASSAAEFVLMGWQTCEHVAFNSGFRENGEELYVLPYWINCETVDPAVAKMIPGFWRSLMFVLPDADRVGWDLGAKISRNELCPCQSGRKFKNCHGAL